MFSNKPSVRVSVQDVVFVTNLIICLVMVHLGNKIAPNGVWPTSTLSSTVFRFLQTNFVPDINQIQ